MINLRLDRLVSLHLVHPARQMFRQQHQGRIPILMYHSIQEGSSDRRPYYNINTSPAQFQQQMKFLRDEGYRAVHLDAAVKSLERGEHNSRHVVITFDDGYRDFFTAAYPVLAEFDHTAVLFVPSGLIEDRRTQFLGRECLTWSEVRELHARGIQIGSHSVTHRELKYMGAAQVEEEVARSKNTIEAKIGQSVESFSYPYAFPETEVVLARTLRELLEKHGYKNGVTTILGTANRASDRFFLPRLPVNSSDDVTLFRAKLEGSYDWLHSVQYLTKTIKRIHRSPGMQTTALESGIES
ncbi:MAG TPA: polysaccharide deacetylase family protein [Candidatus Acidoferrales bacterium]|nr:polysaccharide deacetylase family protein [Candidatus Acidoferrales bacterium]